MRLINMIASHLDCKERLSNFIKLLENIKQQVDFFEKIELLVSISHYQSINREVLMKALSIMTQNFSFQFYYHDQQMSQFQHYQYLLKILPIYLQQDELSDQTLEETWILFSDDDDEWAENRLAIYYYLIHSIHEEELGITTSVCYTHQKERKASNYIGRYTDYCVKLKYFKIFIDHATEEQLKHRYCQCYFVKFLCCYGEGQLKRGFCSMDVVLYHKNEKKNHKVKSKPKKYFEWKKILENNLDLYMAQYQKQNAKDWIKFCDVNSDHKITQGEIKTETVRELIRLYLDKYENHIFNSKHLPVYLSG